MKFLLLHFSPKSITPTVVSTCPPRAPPLHAALPRGNSTMLHGTQNATNLWENRYNANYKRRGYQTLGETFLLYCATSIAIFSLCHIQICLLVYWFVLPKLSVDKRLGVHDLLERGAESNKTNKKSQTVVFCSPLSDNFLVKFSNGPKQIFTFFSASHSNLAWQWIIVAH